MSCHYGGSILESDESFATSLHLISIFEAPILIFGIYIVLTKTPKIMEKVKFPIIVLHLIGAWGDIFLSVLTAPIVLLPATAGYVLGVLYYVVPQWLLVYIGFTSVGLIGPSLILLFESRYNLLVREDSESPSRKVKRFFHHLLNFSFTFLIAIPPFTNLIDVPNFREIVRQRHPCLPEKIIQHPRLYYLNTDPLTIFLCLSIFVLLILIQIFTFLIVTSFHLFKTSNFRSLRTSKLQKQLFKAMCIQIGIPFIVLVFPATYYLFIFATGYFNLAIDNLCVVSVTSHGTFSTIIMLIVHEPYRSATLQIFGICQTPKPTRPYHVSC